MTDGHSAVARDEERNRAYGEVAFLLRQYLLSSEQTEEQKQKIFEAADGVDRVRGGYWGGKTGIRPQVEKELGLLLPACNLHDNRAAWLKLFWTWEDDNWAMFTADTQNKEVIDLTSEDAFDRLLDKSPFLNDSIFFFSATTGAYDSLSKISPQLFRLFKEKLKELDWRDDDPSDMYGIVLNVEMGAPVLNIYFLKGNTVSMQGQRGRGPERWRG